jgi:hypothetical protein
MATDPYRAPELPPLPPHAHGEVVCPQPKASTEKAPNLWIPIALAVAVVLGLSYLYTHSADIQPGARADASGSIGGPTPSPRRISGDAPLFVFPSPEYSVGSGADRTRAPDLAPVASLIAFRR